MILNPVTPWFVGAILWGCVSTAIADAPSTSMQAFLQMHCLDCHAGQAAEAGLDLNELSFDLSQKAVYERWVLIHDRVRDGEMPPDSEVDGPLLGIGESVRPHAIQSDDGAFVSVARNWLGELGIALAKQGARTRQLQGRAVVRRLNRYEYENALRALLDAPWLQVAHLLPEDGIDHLYNKVGERLDMSHVQLTEFLRVSRLAIESAVQSAAHRSTTRKFYARDEPAMRGYLHYRFGQQAATRAIVPLTGLSVDKAVIRKQSPPSVGDTDPVRREQEAMGVFSGVYSATTKYDFSRISAPVDGRYRVRLKTYTFTAGPNGASGGDDHGLSGGRRAWWRPDRNVATVGRRSEPVTLYALSAGGDSRWLTAFDALPNPSVFECVVALRKGENLRPDASRLVRTRPGWSGNPNATPDGVPGVAFQWLTVEGPLSPQWPPASYQRVFGQLPFAIKEGIVKASSQDPQQDATRLLSEFFRLATGNSDPKAVTPFVDIFQSSIELGDDFSAALISAMSAVTVSPEFLFLQSQPGKLTEAQLRKRLAYFLWNGPPTEFERTVEIGSDDALGRAVDRLLDNPRAQRFVDAFLDYWLDLREINTNTPDAQLYPDYYLDEWLTESSVLETREYFKELIDADLPATHLIDSDFAFVNERLALHYGLPAQQGVALRRVPLPKDSVRGGLLTQASILRVTANGTTTSPVIRGAWVVKRLLGEEIADPPSGVAAVEPDIRGAKTIREQLEKHRSLESCNACHAKFDAVGFALESFDVAGGGRSRYRSMGAEGEPVVGLGKNGHAFQFKLSQTVDCQARLRDGSEFEDIVQLKRLLVGEERRLARNMAKQLIVYATGAPITFEDRQQVETILDRCAERRYGLRTMIHEIVQSRLFRNK